MANTKFLLVLVILAGVFFSRSQVSVRFQPQREPLDLTVPSRAVVETEQLSPSKLGYFAWVSGPTLTFRFRQLQAGDLIKIKALAQCGPSSWELVLDGEVLATVQWGSSFKEVRVLLPRDGQQLQLRRLSQASCPLHFSRVKRQGFVATTGEGLGKLYLISASKPHPSAAPWPQALLPWGLALLGAFGLWRLGEAWALYGLLFSSATVWVLQLYGWVFGVRPVYPPSTLQLVLFLPQMMPLAVLLKKQLVSFFGPWKSWTASRSFELLAKPLPSAWVFGGTLAFYLLWLLVTLPQTPMEWDEVLLARGVLRFDVVAHAPHPPGYPLYVGLSKLLFFLGVEAVHATQLASVVGALLALGSVVVLAKLVGLSDLALFMVALWTASLPAFSFAANLGLSDMLACGLALLALVALVRLEQNPRGAGALLAGAMTAFACGTRPQVFLALFGPWALVVWRLSRKREYRWLWSLPAALLVSLAVWLPVLLLTGFERYLKASRHLAFWMDTHEYLSRFPAMEFSRFVADWLVRPLGTAALAWGFWLLCGLGGYLLWRQGHRSLVAFLVSGGLGYLLLAPWTMTAEASVRYALPAYTVLAPLAAGLLAGRASPSLGMTALAFFSLVSFAWLLPALTLRAAEPNPVWAALSWVRQTQAPQVVYVDGGIRPHALFLLKPAGFHVETQDPQKPAPGLWVRSPAMDRGSQVLFSASWPQPKIGQMARRRYLSAQVLRVPHGPSFFAPARPKGGDR